MPRIFPTSHARPTSWAFHLITLVILWAGLLPCHAWRSSLYPENWTPPETASFTTDQLIQDFSYAGYRRGEEPVPEVTGPVFNAVTTYGADPSGARDSTTAIQNAINAAAAAGGGVVFLPAGTYLVAHQGNGNEVLRIDSSNVVLRGAGWGESFILNTSHEMRSKAVIRIAPPSTPLGPIVYLTADLDTPTRRIPVANASAFLPGDIVRMEWTFTQGWIDEHNQGTWWNDPSPRPDAARYLREITAVNRSEGWIEVDVPTRYTMKTRDDARVRRISGQLTGVGIEGLSIGNVQSPKSGFGENDYNVEGTAAWDAHASWLIAMQDSRDSWITGVYSFEAAGNTSTCHMLSNGILLLRSFRVTVADCRMRRSQYGGGGGNGYMFRVQHSNENLIVDSVASFSRHGFVLSHGGTSGNVFLRCDDRETKRSTGSSGSYETSGSGSDHHMHFSHSNLFDQCNAHNSFYTASHRGFSGGTPHALTSAHGVYWNTSGSGTRYTNLVLSSQARYGYVIGTSGSRFSVSNPTTGNTAPADHVEGVGIGEEMEPQSLYLDQLARRAQGILVDAGQDRFTAPAFAYPIVGSIHTYGSDPVSSLWTQVSGPATAVFADASSPTTTVALLEIGTYILELSATDGSRSGSARVAIQVALSTPQSEAHFIRGRAQNTSEDPLGYFTSPSNLIGTSGSTGRINDRNVVLVYTLPTLPPGTALESATLEFRITAARDTTGAANLPELHVYLLDSEDPSESDLAFFYHGPFDDSPDIKRVGTTSVPISGTSENNFGADEHRRFFTLDGDALALLRGYYNGNVPTRRTVYFRFNLSEDPSINDLRRYRVNTATDGSSLYLKPNAIPFVDAGPDQTVTIEDGLPWTPAQLTTAAWYDASDPSTITTQSGNTVSEWRDKSGNDNHATQSTAAVRPTTGSATIGGMNTVAFRIGDGSNKQFLSASNHPSLNLDSTGGVNVFAVMNYLGYVDNGSSGLNAALSKGQLLVSQSAYGIRVGSGDQLGYKAGSNGQVNTANFSNQEIIFSGIGNFAANSAQIFVNGELRGDTNPSGSFASDNSAPLHIGRDDSNLRYANVNFGEILVLGGALSPEDRRKVEGYLAHKWGMAGDLLADHPFKNAAPMIPGSLAVADLDGSASDAENEPLTFSWSVISGPGDVTFADPTAPDSSVSFSSVGSYVLRLSASDGLSTGFNEVTITVENPMVEPKTYDVYLVAGQSNADGRGFTSDLTGGLAHYAGIQENVKIYYVNPTNSNPENPTYNTGWTSLAPGYSVAPGFSGSLPSNRFGFEVSLGKALADHDPERNIAMIKVSRGGTNLHTDWDPSGGANYMWQTFANKVPEALAALTANGDTAEIHGMFWHQGESDGSNPTFESDLAQFIAACRTLTGRADLPFAIGELERDDVTPDVKGRSHQLTAMTNVAAADPKTFVVSSVGLLTYDGTHFTSAAYLTFGERYATAYHDFLEGLNYSVSYNGNESTGGALPVDSRIYNSAATATVLGPGSLVKDGHDFGGWNTAANGSGTAYLGGNIFVISENTILYAQWTPLPSPFEMWAADDTITFQGDANGDGIADGMAWLLGAGNPAQNARPLLPSATVNNGALEVRFSMRNPGARGAAGLELQYGTILGSWITVAIPEESGTHDGVEFSITPDGEFSTVVATVPATAAPDGRLFIRLSGTEN